MRSNAVPAEGMPTMEQSKDIEHQVAGVAHEPRTPLNDLSALADRSLTIQRPQPRRDKSLSILVAEDNPINRIVIGTILDQFGHCHDLVATGAAAVAAVQKGNYDLILMDKQMPELDGLSATRAIRTLSGKKAMTPIIGVTAGAFTHEIEEFRNAGAIAVVTKPVSVRALWQAIDVAFAKRQAE